MLSFDDFGNLTPYQSTITEWLEIENVFVKSFSNSRNRKHLFERLRANINYFSENITPHFDCIIDGSFATLKLNPNDVDVVLFIDYQLFEILENEISKFKSIAIYDEIDVYVEKKYPENHRYFIRYQTDLLYWNQLFTRNRKKQNKGYLTFKNHGNAER